MFNRGWTLQNNLTFINYLILQLENKYYSVHKQVDHSFIVHLDLFNLLCNTIEECRRSLNCRIFCLPLGFFKVEFLAESHVREVALRLRISLVLWHDLREDSIRVLCDPPVMHWSFCKRRLQGRLLLWLHGSLEAIYQFLLCRGLLRISLIVRVRSCRGRPHRFRRLLHPQQGALCHLGAFGLLEVGSEAGAGLREVAPKAVKLGVKMNCAIFWRAISWELVDFQAGPIWVFFRLDPVKGLMATDHLLRHQVRCFRDLLGHFLVFVLLVKLCRLHFFALKVFY